MSSTWPAEYAPFAVLECIIREQIDYHQQKWDTTAGAGARENAKPNLGCRKLNFEQ